MIRIWHKADLSDDSFATSKLQFFKWNSYSFSYLQEG